VITTIMIKVNHYHGEKKSKGWRKKWRKGERVSKRREKMKMEKGRKSKWEKIRVSERK
jgi:hypothetical protein